MNQAVVSSGSHADRDGFPALSDAQFGKIAKLAEDRFGLSLPLSKKPLVLSRLSKRLRELRLDGFDDYLGILADPLNDTGEMDNLLSSLTTNVTHFFRERHHFEMLRSETLPPLIAAAQKGARVRLWSAGCSSGQEAYCLAMTVLEMCPKAAQMDIKILATDVDPQILARAMDGTYASDSVAEQDRPVFKKYFDDVGTDRIGATASLRRLISFGQINLIADWPIRGPFDVIFCRNVAIYFEKETQANMWQRFSDLMRPGGYLFIGHSERIADPARHSLKPHGVTTYLRIGGG